MRFATPFDRPRILRGLERFRGFDARACLDASAVLVAEKWWVAVQWWGTWLWITLLANDGAPRAEVRDSLFSLGRAWGAEGLAAVTQRGPWKRLLRIVGVTAELAEHDGKLYIFARCEMGGSPGTTTVNVPPALRPPHYGFAHSFYGRPMRDLVGMGLPSFPGQMDPGVSPTMQGAMGMAQGYGLSPAPAIMGLAQGQLGSLMGGANNFPGYQFGPAQNPLWHFQNPGMPSFGQGYQNFFGAPGSPRSPWTGG